jgi:hypothetical protein
MSGTLMLISNSGVYLEQLTGKKSYLFFKHSIYKYLNNIDKKPA